MASTRSSPPADAARVAQAVRDAVARLVAAHPSPPRLAVALSGGRDSMALLDALASTPDATRLALSAVHVHHGLSPDAERWAQFCAAECSRRGVPLRVARVRVARRGGESLEAAARDARYAALAALDVDCIALAHHADDQAETLLLQLVRGAGPHGLAAMARERRGTGPTLLRPLLALRRADIEAYVAERGVAYIDDESNDDTRHKRNFLRHEISPRLAAAFPGYPRTLLRAARHQADAAELLDAIAAEDAAIAGYASGPNPALDRSAVIALARAAPSRARNLLRWFIRAQGLPAPSTARLATMLAQLLNAAADARVRCRHAGLELGIHRDRVVLHAPPPSPYRVRWDGADTLVLPHGTLHFAASEGNGLARSALGEREIIVQPRRGGELLRIAANRPRQPLKRLFHDAGVPEWDRGGWPLVWCGEALAAVPGIGVALEFQSRGSAPGYTLRWQPGIAGDADVLK